MLTRSGPYVILARPEQAEELKEGALVETRPLGKTGESFPDYECGQSDIPFWIRYAQGRGANLTIDFNDGDYMFMILKM